MYVDGCKTSREFSYQTIIVVIVKSIHKQLHAHTHTPMLAFTLYIIRNDTMLLLDKDALLVIFHVLPGL